MSRPLVRVVGYGLIALAVLWFCMTGACTYALTGKAETISELATGAGMVLVFSPLVFGSPALALWLGFRLRRPAATEPARRPVRPLTGAAGGLLILLGAWLSVSLGPYLFMAKTSDTYDFFMPLYGQVNVVHMLLVGVLMSILGAWLLLGPSGLSRRRRR